MLDWLNKVVAMLAEIFMLRSEAAPRLQEQNDLAKQQCVHVGPVHSQRSIRI